MPLKSKIALKLLGDFVVNAHDLHKTLLYAPG
jgi:hypothetical protein